MTPLLITDLKMSQCRYPTGQDARRQHLFCGEPVEGEKCPYCPTHAALCFDRRPSERKRADRERAMIMLAMRARPVKPPANMLAKAHQDDVFGRDS